MKIEETSFAASDKIFLNTKTQRHKVAIAKAKYRRRQISRSNYHEANIAKVFNIEKPPKTL